MPVNVGLEIYQLFKNHGVLPFRGSWLEQPTYVRQTILILGKVERFHEQQKHQPDTSILPRVDDLLKRNGKR